MNPEKSGILNRLVPPGEGESPQELWDRTQAFLRSTEGCSDQELLEMFQIGQPNNNGHTERELSNGLTPIDGTLARVNPDGSVAGAHPDGEGWRGRRSTEQVKWVVAKVESGKM